ncbi:MAG: urease accessory protein UreF [Acidimicrobiales bacterium]
MGRALPVAALLLADGRFPNGSHAHSGGVEEAAKVGLVSDMASLRAFLVGTARTAGLLSAGLAAAACSMVQGGPTSSDDAVAGSERTSAVGDRLDELRALDAEADARMSSSAQRRTSRQRGRQLLRVARAAWPGPLLDALAGAVNQPHHAVVLGTAAAEAGLTPADAAACAAHEAVAGPAGAAVRLLGLDPIAVAAMLAELAPLLDRISAEAAACVPSSGATLVGSGWMARLPAPAGPLLCHLAEAHADREGRLFAS